MKLWNNLRTLWLLCLISMLGIIMMLLVNGILDWIMLLIAALPLIIAVYRVHQRSKE